MDRTATRRKFLKQSLKLGSTAIALPAIFPRGILGDNSPNERIITGHIGVGGMGTGQLNWFKNHAGAICDVYEPNLKRGAGVVGRYVPLYKDFRQLLDQKDIDGVVIATPDHWHAIMMIMACESGKDVYVQKPACNTIEEGRAMVNATRRCGRIVQVGSQGRSQPGAFHACQYVGNGMIGRVRKITCWHYENPVGGTKPDSDPPSNLDWDLWLGPNRWIPYNEDRTMVNFRWMLDFGGGQIRDRGAHVMSVAFFIMNSDNTGPVTVEATGTAPETGFYDCPVDMNITYEFKNPDWTMTWTQPSTEEFKKLAGYGAKYWGDDGTLIVRGGDGGTYTEEKALEYEPPPRGFVPYKSPKHEQNWLDCMRSRKQPIMHIESGVRVASLCILGNISYILGRKLHWDPVAERCIGDEEANRFLSKPYRAPWHL